MMAWHVRSKAVEGEKKHQGVEINDGALISSFAEVINDFLALGDKDIAGVLSESLDVEDVASEPALKLPLGAIATKDTTYSMRER
jgi:hypothetical protein